MTALHLLAMKGEVELIRELVEMGVDITKKDELGETVIFHGLGSGGNYELLVRLYVFHNGDLDDINQQGVK